MAFDDRKNFAMTTVQTAPTPAASGTSLTVATGTGTVFPAVPFNAVVQPANSIATSATAEIVRVTNVTGDALTITRTQEGTSARTIVNGDWIIAAITIKALDDLETYHPQTLLTAKGDLLTASAANTPARLAVGANGQALIADSTQTTGLGYGAFENGNLLINGGFNFFQRITPSTATAMSDDAYNAPDRWYSLVQGANATINRDAGIGTSRYACKLVAGGTTNRYGIAQIVEASNSIPMRGRTVRAQVNLKPVNNAGSGTRKYRIAILEWTGTADSVTSELVADWTSATFTTAGFFASTTKTLVGCATVTATHNTETALSVSGTVSTSCNNLIVFVWAEDVPTHASDYVLIGEAGLYDGNVARAWLPLPVSAELAMCQRYFEYLGGGNQSIGTRAYMTAGSALMITFTYKSIKRASPTTTIIGSSWTRQNINQNAPIVNSGTDNVVTIAANVTNTGDTYYLTSNATDGITAEAEL